MIQNFGGMNSEYFNFYRDGKHILTYNLSLKKFHVDSDLSKFHSG